MFQPVLIMAGIEAEDMPDDGEGEMEGEGWACKLKPGMNHSARARRHADQIDFTDTDQIRPAHAQIRSDQIRACA